MAPPSYARATASSTSKASPVSSKTTKDANIPKSAFSLSAKKAVKPREGNKIIASPDPKTSASPSDTSHSSPAHQETKAKLKRPSRLTTHQKDTIAYKRDLYPILPKDASKPCILAALPSELRTEIYTYILPTTNNIPSCLSMMKRYKRHLSPPLLNVSRAIRIEAAYTYYTTATFSFTVRNLDFAPIIRWLELLPKQHRALLSRNRGLEINVMPSVNNTFTYPPKGWLVDGDLEDHWRACQPFGNIYTIPNDLHKKHFLVFCRLAEWWRWCSRPVNRGMRWKYSFEQSPFANPFGMPDLHEEAVLKRFLKNYGMAVAMPCVDKTWKRNRNVGRAMKGEAVTWLEALDQWCKQRYGRGEGDGEWDGWMKEAKKAVGKW
ncbi:hypothetical protein TW65_06226 [Stemphylium lycopersici]|nr:hypothetical protein TW65_06226 [Stemphylium lycopersici]